MTESSRGWTRMIIEIVLGLLTALAITAPALIYAYLER